MSNPQAIAEPQADTSHTLADIPGLNVDLPDHMFMDIFDQRTDAEYDETSKKLDKMDIVEKFCQNQKTDIYEVWDKEQRVQLETDLHDGTVVRSKYRNERFVLLKRARKLHDKTVFYLGVAACAKCPDDAPPCFYSQDFDTATRLERIRIQTEKNPDMTPDELSKIKTKRYAGKTLTDHLNHRCKGVKRKASVQTERQISGSIKNSTQLTDKKPILQALLSAQANMVITSRSPSTLSNNDYLREVVDLACALKESTQCTKASDFTYSAQSVTVSLIEP